MEDLIDEAKSNHFNSFKKANIPENFKLKLARIASFRRITRPECITDIYGRTLVHLEQLKDYNAVIKATKAINHYYFDTLDNPSHRSSGFWTDFAEHFGVYLRYNVLPYTSSDIASSHNAEHRACVDNLLHELTPLSVSINKFFKKYYRNLYTKLNQVKWGPFAPRSFGIFPMIAINYNIISSYHWDRNDEPDSLCCLVALGDYEGGELCFPQLEIVISLRPNQVVLFSSNFLLHGNLPVVRGIRHSIVYFIHSDLFHHRRNFTKIYNNYKTEIKNGGSEEVQEDFYKTTLNKIKTLSKPKNEQLRKPESEDSRRENIGILFIYINNF
jgi:hypothetical protein